MSKPQFIKLRNGVLFRLEDVRLVSRKDINQYNVVLQDLPMAPQADATDVAFLESLMDIQTTPSVTVDVPARKPEEMPASRLKLTE